MRKASELSSTTWYIQTVCPPVDATTPTSFLLVIQPASQPVSLAQSHIICSMSADHVRPDHGVAPTKFALVLFPGFQALDAFGPIDILNILSKTSSLSLVLLAATMDPVPTNPTGSGHSIGQKIVPTHTFETCPEDVQVLLVPGGFGTRDEAVIGPVVQFVASIYPKLRYLLSVCTGSAALAMSGVLDGKRATSNKRSWDWATAQGPRVEWVRKARWVTDGNIWTSSGVSAGIDMMYAFVADQFGEDVAARISKASEYVRNKDPDDDPFA
ncbi:class I glutamine amidotransferase-like protein [Xylariaceae sp. FL0804]|nr:class I glutamine amidotransferase-like protein [Xylariaceae sp. FL0804]